MIHNQFEHLFGEIHTRSIGDTFNAERHGISSGWNHEFSMIPDSPKQPNKVFEKSSALWAGSFTMLQVLRNSTHREGCTVDSE